MHDLTDIAHWLQHHPVHHDSAVHTTLPDPTFISGGQEVVSFSTNNYLALANHPRLVAAAKRGLDRYGVGNCESRLLGGDLEVYRELDPATLSEADHAWLKTRGFVDGTLKPDEVAAALGGKSSGAELWPWLAVGVLALLLFKSLMTWRMASLQAAPTPLANA